MSLRTEQGNILLPTAWKSDLFWPDRNKTDLWNGKTKAFYFCRLRPAEAIVACVASVSVWFRSKEIPRKGTFDFDRALLLAPLFSRSLTLVWLSPRSFLLNRTETLATQAKAIGSGLLSYDDTCMTEECREKHLALIIRHKIRRA